MCTKLPLFELFSRLASVETWYCDARSKIMHGTPKIKHEIRRPIGDRRHGCGCYRSHRNTCCSRYYNDCYGNNLRRDAWACHEDLIDLLTLSNSKVLLKSCFLWYKCVAGGEGISPRILFLDHFTDFIIFCSLAYIFRYTWMQKEKIGWCGSVLQRVQEVNEAPQGLVRLVAVHSYGTSPYLA